jgi:hypothetical protein
VSALGVAAITFDAKAYRVGEAYSWGDLPATTRREAIAQDADLEARFGRGAKELFYRFVVVPHPDLLRFLSDRYGPRLDDALESPEIRELARKIERRGLQHPPVGEDGLERALAVAALGWDLPYFEVVEPFGPMEPVFIPTLEGKRRELPQDPLSKELREGIWRMWLRIHAGLPGIRGTGRVNCMGTGRARTRSCQFIGGNAGVNTAWVLRPGPVMGMIDAMPIVGLYLFGALFPQVFDVAGLRGNVSTMIERLEREFGMISPVELERGTEPFPE